MQVVELGAACDGEAFGAHVVGEVFESGGEDECVGDEVLDSCGAGGVEVHSVCHFPVAAAGDDCGDSDGEFGVLFCELLEWVVEAGAERVVPFVE